MTITNTLFPKLIPVSINLYILVGDPIPVCERRVGRTPSVRGAIRLINQVHARGSRQRMDPILNSVFFLQAWLGCQLSFYLFLLLACIMVISRAFFFVSVTRIFLLLGLALICS